MNNLKYNEDIIKYFELELSLLNRTYLIKKGLPILRNRMAFFHPTMLIQKITSKNQTYFIIGTLSWGGVVHNHVGLKNAGNHDSVYLIKMKRDGVKNIKFINSNLDSFIDFQTSIGFFNQKYYDKVINQIKIKSEAIKNELLGLKTTLKSKDKLGFNSGYWTEFILYMEIDYWGDYIEGIAYDSYIKRDKPLDLDIEDSETLPF